MNLILANSDYRNHMTDEGEQLQAGLAAAGWVLAGHGYGDGCRHVPTLLVRHQPERIFVQDCRDWRIDSRGCFNRAVAFTDWDVLRFRPDNVKLFTVCKDAGTVIDYQREFADDVRADGIVVYYHPHSVCTVAPWLSERQLIRTYHSLDRNVCDGVDYCRPRRRGLVSGASGGGRNGVYPLRRMVMEQAADWKIDFQPHPGYSNQGCHTPSYLKTLAGYRVHLACSSRYRFALRKIIESVAMGAIPVTDLPTYDRLPEIDGALVRVRAGATPDEVRHVINLADEAWNLDERHAWAEKARRYYDFRRIGGALAGQMATDYGLRTAGTPELCQP